MIGDSTFNRAWDAVVVPRLANVLGEWHSWETVDNEASNEMDWTFGVDGYVTTYTGRKLLAAKRIQIGPAFPTMTVRSRTANGNPSELDKLLNNQCRSHIHIHAYVMPDGTSNQLRRLYVADSHILRQLALDGDYYTQTNGNDGSQFAVFAWCDVAKMTTPDDTAFCWITPEPMPAR